MVANGPTFNDRPGTEPRWNHNDRSARPVRCKIELCGRRFRRNSSAFRASPRRPAEVVAAHSAQPLAGPLSSYPSASNANEQQRHGRQADDRPDRYADELHRQVRRPARYRREAHNEVPAVLIKQPRVLGIARVSITLGCHHNTRGITQRDGVKRAGINRKSHDDRRADALVCQTQAAVGSVEKPDVLWRPRHAKHERAE